MDFSQKKQTAKPSLIQAILAEDGLQHGDNKEEQIIWEGRPNYASFKFHKVVMPFIFLAFPLMLTAFLIFSSIIIRDYPEEAIVFTIMAAIVGILIIFPLITTIIKAIMIRRIWEDTYFVVTTQKTIIQSRGIIRSEIKSLFYAEVTRVILKKDIIDSINKAGTIRFIFHGFGMDHIEDNRGSRSAALSQLCHINDVDMIFAKLQKKVADYRNVQNVRIRNNSNNRR